MDAEPSGPGTSIGDEAGADDARLAEPNRAADAYNTIKRRIIEMEMAPGAPFTEHKLAASLQLSKTPVREALVRLRQEGLVEATARSGYRVTPVTFKDARSLFQLRSLLEVEAAGMAAERGSDLDALVELEQLGRESYDASDRASVIRFIAHNTRFHVTLARLGGNRFLASVLEQVLEQLERLMLIGLGLRARGDEIVHEHQELLQAIKAGDADGARRVASAQAASSQLMMLDALLSSEPLLSTNLVQLDGG
jgi:DNA-binding GntR family transcriptional regulator